MNKRIEKQFFAVFNRLSSDCLTYIESKYDLWYKENKNAKTILSPDWRQYVFEVLPTQIISSFKKCIPLLANITNLMEEIEGNFDECKTPEELERYVVRLSEPFRELCENTTRIYQHCNFEGCKAEIVDEMRKLGTVENCLHDLYHIMTMYANRLYALLIERGFDLDEFQHETEIYMKDGWSSFEIAPFLGGMKRAQRFMEKQPTHTNTPSAKDEGNSYITNDKILKALPDLYDCLYEDGVINGDDISKFDFGGKVAQGDIPRLRQGESEWVKKITKFKGFIKCIRHCFNDDWYSAICKSADLTDKEMGKYNTDNTADFEVTIKAKLKKNGIG